MGKTFGCAFGEGEPDYTQPHGVKNRSSRDLRAEPLDFKPVGKAAVATLAQLREELAAVALDLGGAALPPASYPPVLRAGARGRRRREVVRVLARKLLEELTAAGYLRLGRAAVTQTFAAAAA